jgi:topoisomerase IA-like protein
VTDGTKNARISKTIDPQKMNLQQAKELLANSKPKRKRIIRRHR